MRKLAFGIVLLSCVAFHANAQQAGARVTVGSTTVTIRGLDANNTGIKLACKGIAAGIAGFVAVATRGHLGMSSEAVAAGTYAAAEEVGKESFSDLCASAMVEIETLRYEGMVRRNQSLVDWMQSCDLGPCARPPVIRELSTGAGWTTTDVLASSGMFIDDRENWLQVNLPRTGYSIDPL